jgi:hypothetical protein
MSYTDDVAAILRAHNWYAADHWHCGCSPAGLCPTHVRMRNEEKK